MDLQVETAPGRKRRSRKADTGSSSVTPVEIRISSYQVRDRNNNKYVWGVGIPKYFLFDQRLGNPRLKLSADNGELKVVLGDEGVKVSTALSGAFAQASSIGVGHLSGVMLPDEVMRAVKITGQYDPQSGIIHLPSNLPDTIARAISRAEQTAKEFEEAADKDRHFPAHNFQEDIVAAASQIPVPDPQKGEHQSINQFALTEAEPATTVQITPKDEFKPLWKPQSLEDLPPLRTIEELKESRPSWEIAAKDWFEDRIVRAQFMPGGIFTEVVTLEPVLARELLTHNQGNRSIRLAKKAQYVDDIRSGRWQLNGETIVVSKEGALNNGQHRCSAVIEAEAAMPTIIVFGVEKETRKTVDQGANRSPGDHLAIEGYAYATALAAVCRFVLAYERGNCERLAETNRITATEVVERAMEDKLMQESAAWSYKHSRAKRFAPPSVLGFCHYFFSQRDRNTAEHFLDQVINGLELHEYDPAYVVRERLIDLGSKLREHKIEILVRGWNAFRENRQVTRLPVLNLIPRIV